MKQKIIVGITGASGIVYGQRLLEILQTLPTIETHLIVSKAAEQTRHVELEQSSIELKTLADHHYAIHDIGAVISSGSFKTDGMIIAPCSMSTLGEIANGITTDLITRSADVVLKERRKLVLIPRESPLHQGHLENMLKVTQLGAIVAPPMPAFYNHPKTVDDIVNHTVGRVLDLFNIEVEGLVKRWKSDA